MFLIKEKLSQTILLFALPLALLAALVLLKPTGTQATGEVGYWHFDETIGTIAADSSGNSNTGTLINGPVWVAGKSGNALQFDGVNDYVSAQNSISTNYLSYTQDYSVEAWIKANDLIELILSFC